MGPFDQPSSLREREVHVYLRNNFHSRAVEQCGPVFPLAHGFAGRFDQQGMAADQLEILNPAVAANDRSETNSALDASLIGEWRIYGIDLVDQVLLLHSSAHPDACDRVVRRARGRRRRGRLH